MRRLPALLVTLFLPGLLLALFGRPFNIPSPTAAQSQKLHPHLQTQLAEADPGEPVPVLIHLAGRASLAPDSLPDGRLERRRAVIARLQAAADAGQPALIADLGGLGASDVKRLWIINAVAARVPAEALPTLAARSDVTAIDLDAPRPYLPPTESIPASLTGELTWGLGQIRAGHVWDALGVDGTGVTVAVMDTGADWQHPTLAANYRGAGGVHTGHWFDAVDGSPEPVDPHGHGTHVLGTAVGADGIGVAPGATWIAVRVFNQHGNGGSSDIHAGFQWLLAPGGDPALAPDIVNNSWSGHPSDLSFIADVRALEAAGIIPLFAAGNNGPAPGTVGAPASYTGTLAVAASDQDDRPTWFSARGPSAATAQPKPLLMAPGGHTLSALPGGQYGFLNGTSMAAPHAAGTIALMLAANPGLDRTAVAATLTATVAGPDRPHAPDAGWGRLDAYAAVAAAGGADFATIFGTVTFNGQPQPGTAVTLTLPSGAMPFTTDAWGGYRVHLRPGPFHLRVAPFGYAPAQIARGAAAGEVIEQNFRLVDLPRTAVSGHVRDESGQPLAATVSVVGTSLTATADALGGYTLLLPAGTHQIRAAADGHRLVEKHIATAGRPITGLDFALPPAPSVLLVDGAPLYDTAVDIYRAALTDAGYLFDLWTIRNPFGDSPTGDDLAAYEVVIWSSPSGSPGEVTGGSQALLDYLGGGGALLVAGPNVAELDDNRTPRRLWWEYDVRASYLGDAAAPYQMTGEPGTPFEGMTLTLTGPDVIGHQPPDRVELAPNDRARVALRHADGTAAGLSRTICGITDIVYLGFGLEAVPDAPMRATLLARSLEALTAVNSTPDLHLLPLQTAGLVLPGDHFPLNFVLKNLSETLTDTYDVQLEGAVWPGIPPRTTATVPPCRFFPLRAEVMVPEDAPPGASQSMTLTAVSRNDPSVQAQASIRHWTPGHILFVDDDRWYNREGDIQAALDAAGVAYDTVASDYWRLSPELLAHYTFVVWYTGYDWLMPITDAEHDMLYDFVADGGRLLLTSQDYLYYHAADRLTHDFLGVVDYRGSVTPTAVFGGPSPGLLSDLPGPWPLAFPPYQNNGDSLRPSANSQVLLWSDVGAAAVGRAGPDWRTAFWGIPAETLPITMRAAALGRSLGWLGDLGDSSLVVDRPFATAGQTRAFTLTLRNGAAMTNRVAVTNTLPVGLVLEPGSLTGGATYDPATRQITWQGDLPGGMGRRIRYRATPIVGTGQLTNQATVHYQGHDLGLDLAAPLWIDRPDLRRTAVWATTARAEEPVTLTLALDNDSPVAAPTAAASLRLPLERGVLTDTLRASDGRAWLTDEALYWEGALLEGAPVTVTLVLTSSPEMIESVWLPLTAVLDDGWGNVILATGEQVIRPWQQFLPVVGGW